MKTIEFPIQYQKTLIYAGLESISPVDMMSEIEGGQFSSTSEKWKNSVIEFISINLEANLIQEFPPNQENSGYSNIHEIQSALKNSDPTENPEIWMVMQFTGTDELIQMLSLHGLHNWGAFNSDLNSIFISALEQKYYSID